MANSHQSGRGFILYIAIYVTNVPYKAKLAAICLGSNIRAWGNIPWMRVQLEKIKSVFCLRSAHARKALKPSSDSCETQFAKKHLQHLMSPFMSQPTHLRATEQ